MADPGQEPERREEEDDAEARRRRAAAIRESIERLRSRRPEDEPLPLSPREFTDRAAREAAAEAEGEAQLDDDPPADDPVEQDEP